MIWQHAATLPSVAASFHGPSIVWAEELDLYVVVGADLDAGLGVIFTSPDAITWTSRTPPGSVLDRWNDVAWSPTLGLFAAVSFSGASAAVRIMTSPDGITWTYRTSPLNVQHRQIAWSPALGMFAATLSSGGTNRVITSTDGITWTARAANSNQWDAIAWSPELALFAAVARSGVLNRAMTSPDGITWTIRTTPASDIVWDGLFWNGLRFVAVSGTSPHVMTSDNGITWVYRSVPTSSVWRASGYSTALGKSIILNTTDDSLESDDGITWIDGTPVLPISSAWNRRIVERTGQLAAVSAAGEVITAVTISNSYTMASVSDCTQGDMRGGDVLRITLTSGDEFAATDVFIVNFGGTDVEATRISGTVLEVVTPAHAAGTITPTLLRVQADTEDNLPAYVYAVSFPVVYGITPNQGPIAGGTAVTVTGQAFPVGARVLFNGSPATSVVVVDPTQITCVTPAHTEGPVDVTILGA